MIIIENFVRREATTEELAEMKAEQERQEAEYWNTIDYGEAINAEIRKKYSESQEFAILRQKDEKPEEYAAYYQFCEECKSLVKSKKAQAGD